MQLLGRNNVLLLLLCSQFSVVIIDVLLKSMSRANGGLANACDDSTLNSKICT